MGGDWSVNPDYVGATVAPFSNRAAFDATHGCKLRSRGTRRFNCDRLLLLARDVQHAARQKDLPLT